MPCRRLSCVFGVIFFTLTSHAQVHPTDLARDPSWLRLLHYEPSLFGGYRSSARSADFFLSDSGATNPQAELESTIGKLFRGDKKIEERCRFPARFQWLRRVLNLQSLEPDTLDKCADFKTWKDHLDAKSLSLVHPESSLESSVSVFSHTFLKVVSNRYQPESRLHTSISFAASFRPSDSFLKLAFLGIFGGYDGKYGTDDYYADVIRYGVKDSRDIFEYDLALTHEEVDQIVNHIWEVRNTKFDYLFLSRNCSYFLLTLIEVGRPELNISDQFRHLTIPIESVKAVVNEPHFVSATHYIPSKQRAGLYQLRRLNKTSRIAYDEFVAAPVLIKEWSTKTRALTPEDRAMALDALINTWTDDKFAGLATERHAALALRALEPPGLLDDHAILPKSYPQDFHGSHLLGLSIAGRDHEAHVFPMLRYRFVFHDILNDDSGAVPNTTVEALDIEAQFLNQALSIYRTTLFNILSLHPADEGGQPSWLFRSRWQGLLENRGGVGYAYLTDHVRAFAMALGQLDTPNILSSAVFAGPSAGAVIDFNQKFNVLIDAGYLFAASPNQSGKFIDDATLNFKYEKNGELRLIYERIAAEQLYKLSLLKYF